jgi:hypothetical protein
MCYYINRKKYIYSKSIEYTVSVGNDGDWVNYWILIKRNNEVDRWKDVFNLINTVLKDCPLTNKKKNNGLEYTNDYGLKVESSSDDYSEIVWGVKITLGIHDGYYLVSLDYYPGTSEIFGNHNVCPYGFINHKYDGSFDGWIEVMGGCEKVNKMNLVRICNDDKKMLKVDKGVVYPSNIIRLIVDSIKTGDKPTIFHDKYDEMYLNGSIGKFEFIPIHIPSFTRKDDSQVYYRVGGYLTVR